MTRLTDGPNISPAQMANAVNSFRAASAPQAMFPIVSRENRYGFLFEDLQTDPANLLIPDSTTAENLIKLGVSMVDPNPIDPAFDSKIPSAYTYLGQLIDHDVTRQSFATPPVLDKTTLPLSLDNIRATSNSRTVGLDLDCIYGPAIEPGTSYDIPRDPQNADKLRLERMANPPPISPELPREQNTPHNALIGDRRNDENLIISQLHLAFMLAHNRLVDEGKTFEDARQLLRRHYQWMVVNDYLFKIADPDIVNAVLEGKIEAFDPPDEDTFMPLEFSVAAFRFGHSMIRNGYNYNEIFEKAQLFQLFLPGFLKDYHHIPIDWTIDWRRFVDGRNMARRIDTNLVPGLNRIDDGQGHTLKISLATVDLLKCFLLRVPTGEAVVRRLGETAISTGKMLELKVITQEQAELLSNESFKDRTPLWFYILAEAQCSGTNRLGRIGSRIVASVLIGLARKSKDSYLRIKDWTPTLGTRSRFDLPDLFQFAGLLPNDN
jgi:hypothetical protein